MRNARLLAVLLAASLLSGCIPPQPGTGTVTVPPHEPAPSVAATSSTAPSGTPSASDGLRVGSLVHDAPPNAAEASDALASARRELPTIAGFWYEHPRGARTPPLPATLPQLLREATCALVPVYRYEGAPASASSLFDVTSAAPREYVLAILRKGSIIGAADWADNGYGWFSFFADPETVDLRGAETRLAGYFGAREVGVRVVGIPRGYWVVGRSGADERAAFLRVQGSYGDDPDPTRLYTVAEVLAYGTPHAQSAQ